MAPTIRPSEGGKTSCVRNACFIYRGVFDVLSSPASRHACIGARYSKFSRFVSTTTKRRGYGDAPISPRDWMARCATNALRRRPRPAAPHRGKPSGRPIPSLLRFHPGHRAAKRRRTRHAYVGFGRGSRCGGGRRLTNRERGEKECGHEERLYTGRGHVARRCPSGRAAPLSR
jgi:hypothetical protein